MNAIFFSLAPALRGEGWGEGRDDQKSGQSMPDHDWLLNRARELRREQTSTEAMLWRILRARRFAGFKFRRQIVLGGYILDFYCAKCKLVIELDGDSHAGNEESDRIRTSELERVFGLKVMRFWNPEVYDNLDGILDVVYDECLRRDASLEKNPSPQPSPRKAGAREKKRGRRAGNRDRTKGRQAADGEK
jgi:very-short-patch-repair endonuclease